MITLTSRYCSFLEILQSNRSHHFSRALLDPQFLAFRVDRLVRRINVLTYFFVGAQDATFRLEVQKDYWRHLSAPHGTEFLGVQSIDALTTSGAVGIFHSRSTTSACTDVALGVHRNQTILTTYTPRKVLYGSEAQDIQIVHANRGL